MTTPQSMKDHCIEAVETFRGLRIRVGPSSKSGFWPEFQFDRTKDYAPDTTRIIRLPTAIEIQHAEQFTGWVNTYLDEQERKDIWQWGTLKVLPHRTIRGYCEKIGLREHEYRRQINRIFQKLAFTVSGNSAVLCSLSVDDNENTGENRASSGRIARVKGIEVYRPDEARPEHLPDSAQHKRLISDLLKRQRQRTAA